MHRLQRILEKPYRRVVGLMSGTSADAIDAVLAEVHGKGKDTQVHTRAFQKFPFPPEIRNRILLAGRADTREIALLHREIGERFGRAALDLLRQTGVSKEQLDLVGSHGQTVFHHSGEGTKVSLQLGDGDFIAEMTGAIVVSDFRSRDIAAGGEGAPIAAYPDYLLFHEAADFVVILNLGGIANLTWLEADPDRLLAFDLGPANMVIDGLVSRFSDGRRNIDSGGELAAKGKVSQALLNWMLQHPFLVKPYPKSTGRESFGADFVERLIQQAPELGFENFVATATEFSARAIGLGLRSLLREKFGKDSSSKIPLRIFVGGGGVHNPSLMGAIRKELSPFPVETTQKLGVDPDAREAIAMAVLANECVHGLPGNHPAATGAKRPVPLGKISW